MNVSVQCSKVASFANITLDSSGGCCRNNSGIYCSPYGNIVGLNFSLLHHKLHSVFPPLLSLKWLENLDVSHCNLTGNIPEWIGDLSNLTHINLSHNFLNGTLPQSFSNLKKLTSLKLSSNVISGEINVLGELFEYGLNFQVEDANMNCFSFPVAVPGYSNSSLCSTSHIVNETGGNQKCSKVSSWLNRPPDTDCCKDITGITCDSNGNIRNISVGRAFLPGQNGLNKIFPDLSFLTGLEQLDLRNLGIGGTIPDWIGNLVNLREINLSGNRLTGYLPQSMRNLKNLAKLKVASNLLKGDILFLAVLPHLKLVASDITMNCFDFPAGVSPPSGYAEDIWPCKAQKSIGGNLKPNINPVENHAKSIVVAWESTTQTRLNVIPTATSLKPVISSTSAGKDNLAIKFSETTASSQTFPKIEPAIVRAEDLPTDFKSLEPELSAIPLATTTPGSSNEMFAKLFGNSSAETGDFTSTFSNSMETRSNANGIIGGNFKENQSSTESSNSSTAIILPICIILFLAIMIVIVFFVMRRKKRSRAIDFAVMQTDSSTVPESDVSIIDLENHGAKFSTDPFDWTCQELQDWLLNNNFSDATAQKFRNWQINGRTFLRLTNNELKNELKVSLLDLQNIEESIDLLSNTSEKIKFMRQQNALPKYDVC